MNFFKTVDYVVSNPGFMIEDQSIDGILEIQFQKQTTSLFSKTTETEIYYLKVSPIKNAKNSKPINYFMTYFNTFKDFDNAEILYSFLNIDGSKVDCEKRKFLSRAMQRAKRDTLTNQSEIEINKEANRMKHEISNFLEKRIMKRLKKKEHEKQ